MVKQQKGPIVTEEANPPNCPQLPPIEIYSGQAIVEKRLQDC